MDKYEIKIEWHGPFSPEEVIKKMDDAGEPPDYGGKDYGLYQIYGKHILCGEDTLLYIGRVVEETFATRFRLHKKLWLDNEENIKIYLGRVYDPGKHSKTDNWESWKRDIEIAEKILIYKYSPNYNGREISRRPDLPFENIRLIHSGERHKLEPKDDAPEDYS